MHAGTTAMGPVQMRQPGSSAAANGISAQAAALAEQLSATGQHHCTMLWRHVSFAWSRRMCKCCFGTQASPEIWLTLVLDLLMDHALCNWPYVALHTALTCWLILRIRLLCLLT